MNAKLHAVGAQFLSGNVMRGKNQLRTFINQMPAFGRTGSLSTEQARPVLAYAERVIRDA